MSNNIRTQFLLDLEDMVARNKEFTINVNNGFITVYPDERYIDVELEGEERMERYALDKVRLINYIDCLMDIKNLIPTSIVPYDTIGYWTVLPVNGLAWTPHPPIYTY